MNLGHYLRLFAAGTALLANSGCVEAPPWTRERQDSLTVQLLPVAPAAAIRAAEKAVREIDPRSVTLDYRDDGFVATRSFFTYMVIAAAQGSYTYAVTAEPAAGGSRLTAKIYADVNTITATGTSPGAANMWQAEESYMLLHERIRFHAGLSDAWVSCDNAPKALGTGQLGYEPLCLGATARGPK